MKIGLILYGSLATLSGGYLYDRRLVESLRAQGDTVEIISLPWKNYAAHLGDNLTFRLPAGFDLLIQDELNHPSLIGANLGRYPGPVISLVHHLRCSEQRPHWQNQLYRLVETRYLRSVDGFLFNSQTTRRVVTGLIGSSQPALVAYPPTDRFDPGLTGPQVTDRAQNGPLRLLFLGNLIPRKGLHTLLEALTRLPATDLRLEIVGAPTSDPVYARAMQARAAQPDLAGRVTFHGALDNEPLRTQLRQAHLLVVPSSYEGFGIVYLEGMAFGLPAIGTSAGAAPEIVRHNETGFLIPPGDAPALAAHLALLAADRNRLARMSLAALQRYQQQPKWAQTAAEIRQFLLSQL